LAARDQAWKIRTKRPGVELVYRLYDGNSAGSSGNRDGQVNNGERIEVAVTPANRGDLPARGVRIAVESDDPKLMPRPSALDVGDLPAQAEGVAQRFAFDVPRGYGLDRLEGDLHFTLTVSQQDFPPYREPIPLGFRSLRPELSLETAVPPTLTRGTRGELALRLRNTGRLRAEEIVMEVVSDIPGVDLMDEHGVPVQARKITLGTLDPLAAAPGVSIPINVRRNASLGLAPLRITLTQKDFPQIAQNASVGVTEEGAAVIPAPPTLEPPPERPPAFAPTAQATISFLGHTPGEHLIAEAVVLRFEVQSPAELVEVRLTQNERLLPLEGARWPASVSSGMQLTQFEPTVQLEDGENLFKVVVVTRQGLTSERKLSLFHDREVGRLWVVAVGISKYQDPSIPGLGYADADARAVYDYFRGTFWLPESQVFLRMNEQATLREIKSLLGTQLVARANDPKDTVILYFAGHGMRDRVTGSLDPDGLSKYFLPYDASRADLYSTALEMDEVTNILRRLTPDRVVVLLDSCFSGAAGGRSPFDPKGAGERAPISGEFLDRMAHVGKGRVVLTASGPDQAAQENADFGHGVFTYYLLEGLNGAAGVKDEDDISLLEVYKYISEKVRKVTKGKQDPQLKGDLAGQILIGRSAVHRRR
ncbi:MAG TPA: caspase family protein, partial [Acidimicrobiales bacterium]|nr:caspase family protein [Acidimicrobiales bacterium]